jgi:hypothetical protein
VCSSDLYGAYNETDHILISAVYKYLEQRDIINKKKQYNTVSELFSEFVIDETIKKINQIEDVDIEQYKKIYNPYEKYTELFIFEKIKLSENQAIFLCYLMNHH